MHKMPIGYETTLAVSASFALLLYSIYLGRRDLAGALRKGVNKYSLLFLFIILAFFLAFSLLFVHPAEQLYFDENIYQGVAMNILHHANALWCQFGTGYVDRCYANALYHDPVGWTLFIAIAFALFGIGTATAFNLELLVGALSIVAVFLLASALFENKELAVLGAFVFALSPELFIWSRSMADIDLPFMMLSAFAFFFFVVFAKNRNRNTLAMFLFAMVLAAYMRIEAILLIPLFVFLFFVFGKNSVKETFRRSVSEVKRAINEDAKTLIIVLVALLLLLPQIHYFAIEAQLTFAPGSSNYGQNTGQSAVSLGNFMENIPVNVYYVLGLISGKNIYPTEFLFLETPLAIFGCVLLSLDKEYRNRFGMLALLGLWPLLYFVFYTSFYAGYATYGVDVRFMLQLLPGLCLLAAFAAYDISKRISKRMGRIIAIKRIGHYITIAIASAVLFALPFAAISGAITLSPSQMPQQYQIYQVMQDFYKMHSAVPTNCLVFSSTPDIWYEVGRPAAQADYIFAHNQTTASELSQFSCFVFDYGYWCTVPPQHNGICQAVVNSFKTKVLATNETPDGINVTYYELLNYTP
ncbi:MAG: glycosyltransferase family 39 protein [Candidatus Micrarchaeaceae archaeon]